MHIINYTKLDGTRASKTYEGLFAEERLKEALAAAKTKHPNHNFQEKISFEVPQWIKDLAPVTPDERAAARWFRNNMPAAAYAHGY